MKRLLSYLLFIFLALSIFTAVTSKSGKLFNIRSFVVLSGSMEPSLPTGSVVYTKASSNYLLGDVISFTTKANKTVTHRIVGISPKLFRTAGDANDTTDSELVSQSAIIGSYLFHLPLLGYFAGFLRTPVGFLLMTLIPAFTFIGFELWQIKKEIEAETEKRVLSKYHLNSL